MSDNALKELLRPPVRSNATESARKDEPEGEYRAFAGGRTGDRPQAMVVFRKKNGAVRGLSYLLFYSVEADNPAEQFSMEFSGVRVTVTGRNLEPLFRMVCSHRVAEIREADRTEVFSRSDEEPTVQRIDFRSLKGNDSAG